MDSHFLALVVQNEIPLISQFLLEKFDFFDEFLEEALDAESLIAQSGRNIDIANVDFLQIFFALLGCGLLSFGLLLSEIDRLPGGRHIQLTRKFAVNFELFLD